MTALIKLSFNYFSFYDVISSFRYYCHLVKIPTFRLFRKWKAFAVWRKNVRSHKNAIRRKALQENLFLLNPVIIFTCIVISGWFCAKPTRKNKGSWNVFLRNKLLSISVLFLIEFFIVAEKLIYKRNEWNRLRVLTCRVYSYVSY